MGEGRANVGSRTVEVVGQTLDVEGHAGRAIALIGDLLVDDGISAGAKGLVDGRLDLGVRHRDHTCAGDSRGKRGVVVRVGVPSVAGGNSDVTRVLGEERGALGVNRSLLMLSGSPLRVSGHTDSPSDNGVA